MFLFWNIKKGVWKDDSPTTFNKLILTNPLEVADMNGDGLALFFRYKFPLKEEKY